MNNPTSMPDEAAKVPVAGQAPATPGGADVMPAAPPKIVAKIKGDRIIVNDVYEILLSHPVAEFTHPFADVYEVVQKDNKNQSCLAYVLKHHYPARLDIIQSFIGKDVAGLTTIRSFGITDWIDQTQRLIVIINKPQGSALLTQNVPKRTPVPEDIIRKFIIKPLFHGLQGLAQFGFSHGNIRADNVYWNTTEGSEAVAGDCVTSLCGALQQTLYETIERGMADPLAKGESTPVDDIYALGVLVAVLLRGFDPLAGKPDRFIIDEKISRTTFMVMTDSLQLTPRMSDFFRATLNDDPRMRWTVEQLDSWLNNNRAPLKQYITGKKATRALDFNGQKYIRARLLARDFYDNPAEAVQLIESGNLAKWLDRSLIDQNIITAVDAAVNRANYNGKTAGYEDRLLCYVSIALDPAAPIRYKTVRALPHGLGGLLLHAIVNDQSPQPIAEIIKERIAWFWLNNSDQPIVDAYEWNKKFDILSKCIIRRNMDYGLERCLYDMASTAPCLSPSLKHFYVLDCQQLLQSLNVLGEAKDRPQNIIDRHITAFIASRDIRDNSNLINMLESDDPRKRSMSLLLLLQTLQKRYQAGMLSGLTAWLLKDAELLAQRFHNLKFRRDVIKTLNSDTKNGSLSRMLMTVDNPQDVMRDRAGFDHAVRLYKQLGDEQATLGTHLKTNTLFGRETGRQIAAIISAILAAIFTVGAVVMHYSNNGGS